MEEDEIEIFRMRPEERFPFGSDEESEYDEDLDAWALDDGEDEGGFPSHFQARKGDAIEWRDSA